MAPFHKRKRVPPYRAILIYEHLAFDLHNPAINNLLTVFFPKKFNRYGAAAPRVRYYLRSYINCGCYCVSAAR